MARISWSPALAMVVVVMTMHSLGEYNFVEAYPKDDLVVKLPNQPEVTFKQFAGYVNVDDHRSLFYYYVEAVNESDRKPLTIWLNGGPGCSSVGGGAFTELGPFYPTGDGRGLRVNSKSWNKDSNLLFVDSPAGVGWSYSNRTSDYNTGDESTANDMLVFLLRWFKKFPELKSRDLFLTGESYAGHYVPQLADKILKYNSNSSSSTGFKFNLKGIAIGNPLLRLSTDAPGTFEFYWTHGMISDELRHTIRTQCNFSNASNKSKSCTDSLIESGITISDYLDVFDVHQDFCYPSIAEQELRLNKMVMQMSLGVDVCITYERSFYFNLPQVQQALHANRTRLPYEWSMCSNFLSYSGTDVSMSMLPVLKRIIQKKVPIWIFSGDQDSVVPLLGSRTLVRELAQDLNFKITLPYRAWFHERQVGGWVIEYGELLTFATVRGAAHAVPYAQPSRALHLFTSFITGKKLY